MLPGSVDIYPGSAKVDLCQNIYLVRVRNTSEVRHITLDHFSSFFKDVPGHPDQCWEKDLLREGDVLAPRPVPKKLGCFTKWNEF